MRAIILNKTGGPSVLEVSEVDDPVPKNDEVLVRTKFSGVNYADLLSRQGLYSWVPKRPYIMGLELSGEVEEIGNDVKNVEVGDKVIVGTQMGGYAEMIASKADRVLPAPEQFSFEESAAFMANWFTVWIGLHEMARVREGESLLIHAAAGGVGTAAVMLGLAHNMKVYGTTSSEEKREFVKNIGAVPLSYEDFDIKIMDQEELGVDCILETMGGNIFKRSFEILSPMGRLVQIGASGIQVNKWNPVSWIKAWLALPQVKMAQVLRRSRAFMGLHVGYLGKYPEKIRPAWEKMVEVVTEHDFKPVVNTDQIYPMYKVADAHQLIHDRNNIGKVLLDPTK